jgi:hypothetical protein
MTLILYTREIEAAMMRKQISQRALWKTNSYSRSENPTSSECPITVSPAKEVKHNSTDLASPPLGFTKTEQGLPGSERTG